jgi:hypothetical protein
MIVQSGIGGGVGLPYEFRGIVGIAVTEAFQEYYDSL